MTGAIGVMALDARYPWEASLTAESIANDGDANRQHHRPFGISKCIKPNGLWCLP